MKKIISIVLLLATCMGLFACGNQTDSSTGTTLGTDISTTIATKPTSSTTSSTNQAGTTPTQGTNTSTSTSGTTSSVIGTTTGTGNTTSTTQENPKEDPNPDIDDELALFYELFSLENHVELYLDISNSELKKINDDYKKNSKSPIYRMADLHVTITQPDGTQLKYVIDQVGVRMKGNTSRTEFYSDSKGMYNLVHFKVSFQETFDDPEHYGNDVMVWTDSAARKERKNRTFATLEKIDMRWNKNYDATHIREYYAYELYREMGVLAPHTNLASVDVGSNHCGVWLFYEPIDKIFLEKYLPEEALGGDLYKLGWTDQGGATFTSFTSYGVEDELAGKFYVYDLKTNKKTSDHSALKNLINTINSSSCNKDKFASVVDVENFLMFAAVSYIVGNPDDLRNNYNNCYIYFRADNGKMMIIPYDLDRGLGVNKDWNPSGDHMTTDSPFSDKAIGNGSTQKNPLFTKGILNANFFKNEYVDALKLVGENDMLKVSTFEASFNLAKSLYSKDTTTSKNLGNAGTGIGFDLNKSDGSNMSFSNYINKKTQTLAKYISGYTPDVGGGSGSDTTKEWELYLRGNFNGNNWSNQTQYKFKHLGDGLYSVDVSCSDSLFKFKVYNNRESGDVAWYNTVDEAKTTAWFEYQGGNRNVQVKAGSYTVYFDTKTETLYVVQK